MKGLNNTVTFLYLSALLHEAITFRPPQLKTEYFPELLIKLGFEDNG